MPLEFRRFKDRLPNGLRVVTIELPHLHSASLVVYTKVGSRYEAPEDNGLSHLLEHMLFRGTARYRDSMALNFAIEELGGTLYAETGRDYSLYQIGLHPEAVARGVAIMGEIFGAPTFRDLALEKRLVVEEILEDQDEDGRDINVADLARAALWPEHPLGYKITGSIANIERFTEADVARHFRRFYGAQNLVFAIAGPVAHEEVLAWATAHLGRLPPGEEALLVSPDEAQDRPRFHYVENEGSQTSAQILFRTLPELHPDNMALTALVRTLDDGMSTRLHYRICDQAGLAYYIAGSLEPFIDTGLFEIDGASAHAKLPALVRSCLEICDEYRHRPVEAAELAKAKARYRYDLEATFDDPDALAGWFGGTELFYPPTPFEERCRRMEAVTAADVQRVANLVFRPERLAVACVGELDARREAEVRALVEGFATR